MELEFDATCERVVRSMQLVGAARGTENGGAEGAGELRVRAPLPAA